MKPACKKILMLAMAFFVLTNCQKSTTVSTLWGTLEPGPLDIGFRLITFVDSTRGDSQKEGRHIEISLWYPASPIMEAPRLLFCDYLKLALQRGDSPSPDALQEWLALRISETLTESGVTHLILFSIRPCKHAKRLCRQMMHFH